MISATVKSAADASSYDISFTANVNNYVQVFRSAQNVKDLNEALRRSYSVSIGEPPADLLGESPTSADLERFLNYWLGFFSDDVIVSELLVNFMEDIPGQQNVAQLQFSYFREKVRRHVPTNESPSMVPSFDQVSCPLRCRFSS